jgi:Fe-S-cluster containining protein
MSAARKLPIVIDSYERLDVCAPCGGRCCASMPGAAMPSDFGDTPEAIQATLTERIATGRWASDWWEGNPEGDGDPFATEGSARSYFVRPAIRGKSALFDPAWGGSCTFHGANGCEIFSERPSGCRGLEPSKPPGKCTPRHSTKQDAAVAWLPFHDLILRAADAAGGCK